VTRDAFLHTMRSEMKDLAGRLGITEDRALAAWYAVRAFRLEEEEAKEAVSYDGGNDRGIDLFLVDDERAIVVIGQTKNLKRAEKSPKPADLALLFDTLSELAEPQELLDAGRQDLADAAAALADAKAQGYSVQLHFVYPGAANEDLDRAARRFNRQNNSENVSVTIVRLDDLELIEEDYVGSTSRVEKGTIHLLPDSYHEQDGPYGKALVATITGKSLKELYVAHRERLFDQNVRLFLGTRKGTVNAGIRDTLTDPNDRDNFWAYNNGITIVARTFDLDESDNSVELTDFSVVNGCQTTVSLGEATDKATNRTAVIGRIIAASDPGLVDRIIRYTNSQTPINVWDISARDRTQQQLKKELEEMDPPWFYALRRGELETIPNKKIYGTGTARRVLPFPQSAQYLAAMKGLPVEAYKDKAKLFTAHRDRVFSFDLGAAELLWAWHIGGAVQDSIDKYRERFGDDLIVEAILKRGARLFATSVTAQLLRLRNGDDFVAKIDVDRLADSAMIDRLNKYATLGVAWYVSATRLLIAQGADLTVLLRNVETSASIEQSVKERMYEEEQAPAALEEKLPRLPGIHIKKPPKAR
jgi:hypothetical protein